MNLIVDLVINQCVVYFVGMYVCMEARYFVNRFWWRYDLFTVARCLGLELP